MTERQIRAAKNSGAPTRERATDGEIASARRAFFEHVEGCAPCYRAWWTPVALPAKDKLCPRGKSRRARWWRLEES